MLRTLLVVLVASFGAASTASAQELDVSTQPALYPAFDQSITDYVLRCTLGSPVDVTVTASPGTTADVDGQGPRTGTTTTTVKLNPGQGFRIIATSGPASSTYYVRCLPSDFPAWTFQRSSQPQAEWYMVAPFARTDFGPVPPGVSPDYAAMFDGNGVPVWWANAAPLPIDFRVFPNGNVAWAHFPNANHDYYEEHSLDGRLVRHISAASGYTDDHEMLPLSNGNFMVNALSGRQADLTPCGGPASAVIDNNILEEVRPDGSVVWSWDTADHIALSEVDPVWYAQCRAGDPYHFNSIEDAGNNEVLISYRHLNAVYKVNVTTGDVVWKLGGTAGPESLTVVGDPIAAAGGVLRGQHDARILSDGTVTIHDNGFDPSGSRPPRAVRYAIDENAMTATLVEQKVDPGVISSAVCCGSARRLAGGNWVMSWGSTGLVSELSPSGSRVFSLTFDDGLFSYRAHPVPFGELTRAAVRAGMDAQHPRGYPRPAAAPKVRASLVPSYQQCLSPDLVHGPPLEHGSCGSPDGTSSFLTVGTVDANGAPAKSVGSVIYQVIVGDPSTPASESDVRLRVSLTDVRRRTDLSDYTGELQVQGAVRITDKASGPLQNEAATGFDTEFPAAVPCVATDSSTVGSTCSLTTTFNAIVPGTVVERKRATWQIGKVQLFDGGASEVAGDSGASLFATQGIFVP